MKKTFRIITVGSREFTDYELFKSECDIFIENLLKNNEIVSGVQIISGGAKGADKFGIDYAIEKNMSYEKFIPKWNNIIGKPENEIKSNKFGKKYWVKAGLLRNQEMANYSDILLAFWDGKSRGTLDMIQRAYDKNLIVKVINYNEINNG